MRKRYPLISVIMNCYNGEKFLREAIYSLKNQVYKNWELIFGTIVLMIIQKILLNLLKIKE